jgi:hypothetical protein
MALDAAVLFAMDETCLMFLREACEQSSSARTAVASLPFALVESMVATDRDDEPVPVHGAVPTVV